MGREDLRPDTPVYPVSRLVLMIKTSLEYTFPEVRVRGEISNFLRYSSGHLYFDLKDDQGKIRCVMFRSQADRVSFPPKDGDAVVVRGRVSLYEKRGDTQLIVEEMVSEGLGNLFLRFEALKKRLQEEGLFSQERKRPLPPFPRSIGLVTSPQGAVVMDILRILARRHKGLRILIYPAKVQGEGAAQSLVEGVEAFNRRGDVEVIILARGGGSIEDLWPFNEEIVARAVASSKIPTLSAVGHETDFTICDFAADLRASTPSAAAELVVQRGDLLEERLLSLEEKAHRLLSLRITSLGALTAQRLSSPPFRDFPLRLQRLCMEAEEFEERLLAPLKGKTEKRREALNLLLERLSAYHPLRYLGREKLRLESLENRLLRPLPGQRTALARRVELLQQRLLSLFPAALSKRRLSLEALSGRLEDLSYRRVLERGFALALKEGRPLLDASEARTGDPLRIVLSRGELIAEVKKIKEETLGQEG